MPVTRAIPLIAFAAVLFLLYLVLAWFLVYSSTRAEKRKPFEQFPQDFGLQFEEVTFTPRDGSLKLSGWLMPGAPDAPWLIFVHGINSQRTNAKAVELASRLVTDDGYNVLMFDLRAHGTSEGDSVTAGQKERYDVLGAYDFAVSRGAVPGRIGLVGQSYGAGLAIMAASLEPGVVAVVADSPFSSVEEKAAVEVAIRTPIPEWAVSVFMPASRVFADLLYGIELGNLQPVKDVAQLQYPVLIVHGEADTRTPVSQGRKIYENAPPGSEIWTPPGVEHTKAFEMLPDKYLEHVRAYFGARFAP